MIVDDTDEVPLLPVVEPSTWQGRDPPARNWVVADWVPDSAVTLFAGDGGTGKSMLGLQLAVAVATGQQWLGLPTATGSALVMACEDDVSELHRRLSGIVQRTGKQFAMLSAIRIIAAAGHNAALFEADEGAARGKWTKRFQQLSDLVQSLTPRVVVLDTAADLFAANENSRRQVRQFVSGLTGLAMRSRCAIVLLAHPSRAGMTSNAAYSGSTAWNASVRSRLTLVRPDRGAKDSPDVDPAERILSVGKANYGPDGTAIKLRWSAGIFEPVNAPGRHDRIAREAEVDTVFLDGLIQLDRQGRRDVGTSLHASNYAPSVIAKLPDCAASRSELEAAMQRLLANDVLVVEQVGPPSKRRSYIRRKGGNE